MEKYFFFSALSNAIVSILFGAFVFWKNKKNKVNQTFALFCLAVVAWSVPYMFWPMAVTKGEAFLSFQLLHIGASFTSITYLHFVVTWLGLYKENKKIIIFGYFLAAFFASITFSKYFISDMVPKFSIKFWAEPGVLYHFYLIYFFGYFIYSSYLLFINFRKSSGIKRAQIKFVLVGMVIAFFGGSTNYLLWYDINFPPLGNILVAFYVILGAYAIVKHRLMDIKFVLRKSTVYIASLISIMILAVFTRFSFSGFVLKDISWVEIFILILAIFIFPFLRSFYYRLANKYFFSSLYDGQEVIGKLSEKLGSTLSIDKIYNYIYESLNDAFHVESFGVLKYVELKDKNKNKKERRREYIAQFNKGFSVRRQKKFLGNELLYKKFIIKGKPIVVEEIKNTLNNKKTKTIINFLNKLGVEVIVPLNVGKKNIGLIVIGRKESKDMYNDEDIQVLEIIGSQAAMAIQNALQYEKTKDFNIRLREEVAEATEGLRIANRKLKQLDKAKTAFLSIASHQLRAPLTAIKGFTSLLLDGSYGKLAPEKREVLKKIFDSNERLSKLTENLLNISRIESGRLTFTFEKNSITELVQTVVDEMKLNAEKKGLYLKFEHKKYIKPFIFDKGKMHEVVINIVDNAIKYTKKGGINISIKNEENKLKILIKDTGMGIDPKDKNHIFKKFQRGQHASKIYTEGAGIGLYIVREILKAHNGKLLVESPGLGKGSTFIIEMDKNFKPKKERGGVNKK